MENVENNYNQEAVEEKKEEEVIVPIEVLKVKITEERKKEINKEIALLTEQL